MRYAVIIFVCFSVLSLPTLVAQDEGDLEACDIVFDDLDSDQQSFLNLRAERMWRMRDLLAEWDGNTIQAMEDMQDWAYNADVAAFHSQETEDSLPMCAELAELDAIFDQTLANAYAVPLIVRNVVSDIESDNAYRVERGVALFNYRFDGMVEDVADYEEIFEGLGGYFRDAS